MWNTKEYQERNFPEGRQIGFIAQEFEMQFPEIVSTDEKGYKSIDYSKMTAVLVECVKDQQMQINALREQITTLRSQLNPKMEVTPGKNVAQSVSR